MTFHQSVNTALEQFLAEQLEQASRKSEAERMQRAFDNQQTQSYLRDFLMKEINTRYRYNFPDENIDTPLLGISEKTKKEIRETTAYQAGSSASHQAAAAAARRRRSSSSSVVDTDSSSSDSGSSRSSTPRRHP